MNHEANNFKGAITVQGGLLQTKDQGHSVTLGNDGRIHYTMYGRASIACRHRHQCG